MDSISKFLKGKKVLVIGATGSWGSELVHQLVTDYNPREIRIFSRGEHKQVEMRHIYRGIDHMKYIIGDVRDSEAVERAMAGVNIVFNLAALKHVPVSEENPWEVIQTNVYGINNVITAAFKHATDIIVQVSSDKAVDPINLYGFTKGCAEKLIISANFHPGKPKNSKFVCVRAGNVLGTTGSVVPLFSYLIKKYNKVTITDPSMSRFFMRLEDAIKLVLRAIIESSGGEIFVTKMPGVKITDLSEVLIEHLGNKPTKVEYIGIRPGEKLYEVLVSRNESERTVEDGEYYVILPYWYRQYIKKGKYLKSKAVNFEEYNSRNTKQLDKKGIYKLLKQDGWFDKDKEKPFSSVFSPYT